MANVPHALKHMISKVGLSFTTSSIKLDYKPATLTMPIQFQIPSGLRSSQSIRHLCVATKAVRRNNYIRRNGRTECQRTHVLGVHQSVDENLFVC